MTETINVIPKPKSEFIEVECASCGNKQKIFNRPSTTIKCMACNAVMAEPGACKPIIYEKKKVESKETEKIDKPKENEDNK